jgi:hypothetical protein
MLLIAAMGEALTESERLLFRELTGRDAEPLARIDEFVAVVGRRGGTMSMSRKCGEGPALPGDCEHQASHDDRGGAVRTPARDGRAGAPPLWWRRGAERRGVAGDHALRDRRAITVRP